MTILRGVLSVLVFLAVAGAAGYFIWMRKGHSASYSFLNLATHKDTYLQKGPDGVLKEDVYAYPGTTQDAAAAAKGEIKKDPQPPDGTGGMVFNDGAVKIMIASSNQPGFAKVIVESKANDYEQQHYGYTPKSDEPGTSSASSTQ